MLNSESMVVLHYWPARHTSFIARESNGREGSFVSFSFGHVALEVIKDGDTIEYISFWPGRCAQDNKNSPQRCQSDCSHLHSKDEDHLTFSCPAINSIILKTLNVNFLLEKWEIFKNSSFEWSVLGSSFLSGDRQKNCAGLCFSLINDAGFDNLITTYYNFGIVSGMCTALTPLFFIQLNDCVLNILAFYLYRRTVKSEINILQQFLWYFEPFFCSLASISGVMGALKKSNGSYFLSRNNKEIAANLVGAVLSGLFLGLSMAFGDDNKELLISARGLYKILLWCSRVTYLFYSNENRLMLSMLLFPIIGAYLCGKFNNKIYAMESDYLHYNLDPGFVIGFTSPIIGYIFQKFLFSTRTLSIDNENQNLYLFIGTTVSAAAIAFITKLAIKQVTHYSLVTPRSLYEATIYAASQEKHTPSIKKSPMENASSNIFPEDKKYNNIFTTRNVTIGVIICTAAVSAATIYNNPTEFHGMLKQTKTAMTSLLCKFGLFCTATSISSNAASFENSISNLSLNR